VRRPAVRDPAQGPDQRLTVGGMSVGERPVFLYDFNSPYAYLAAARVDQVLPITPRWQPIAFAFLLRAHNRRPWSFDERERQVGKAECERRAQAYGLPAMRWPPGWPIESYGLTSLRAAVVAMNEGRQRDFARAAFARNFVTGLGLTTLDDVLAVAAEVGIDLDAVTHGVTTGQVKNQLTEATDAAIAAGAVGVPTVLVAGQSFWGDDRLEAAATAISDDGLARYPGRPRAGY
jgi:2-hydroxychromene-2-carboxylate isomerase